MAESPVGKSFRSPIKHYLLNKLLGACVGAAPYLGIRSFIIIDACAGDGVTNPFSGSSSPEIILKHTAYARHHSVDATAYLIERDQNTVEILRRSVANYSFEYGSFYDSSPFQIIPGDYRLTTVAEQIKKGDAAFLHLDPNHVDDVRFPPALRSRFPEKTTMLVPLGCNASGIKRLPPERRKGWFDQLGYLTEVMHFYQDGCLIRLEKDSHQWAYFLTIPKKWRSKFEPNVRKLSKEYWAKGVQSCWIRDSEEAFEEMAKRLFLKVDGSEENL